MAMGSHESVHDDGNNHETDDSHLSTIIRSKNLKLSRELSSNHVMK